MPENEVTELERLRSGREIAMMEISQLRDELSTYQKAIQYLHQWLSAKGVVLQDVRLVGDALRALDERRMV